MIFIREEGRIYHGDPQKPDAFIKYIKAQDGVIKATSTVVDETLRGQGIAKLLLDELVALAREQHWTIIPVCSYVVTAFKRFKEYEDVIFNA